tara:strand:- start:335 stop:724 length:390 start_codon:yes stop_codon:yes gene_type:complete
MSDFKNDGLQVQEYEYDFAVDGGLVSAIDLSAKPGSRILPQGAIVKAVHYSVETAIVGSSSTMAAGNTTSATTYEAATAEATLIADYTIDTGTTPFIVNSAGDADFLMTIGTGALTAGKVKFFVEYLLR